MEDISTFSEALDILGIARIITIEDWMAVSRAEVGVRMKAARMVLGYNQYQFADYLSEKVENWSGERPVVARWEQGLSYPPIEVVVFLHQEHRINADWIFSGENDNLSHRMALLLDEAVEKAKASRGRIGRMLT